MDTNNNLNQIIPNEEKIADGIYITKPCEKKVQRYVYRSTAELINILENENCLFSFAEGCL